MVFYYTCSNPKYQYIIYSGRDKFENEELISYGWREDIWFHVEGLSSAHLYLRPPEPKLPGDISLDIDSIPDDVMEEICQATKYNSIAGCKQDHVDIVYTPWYNLKKEAGFAPGQVTFHKDSLVRHKRKVKKIPEILNAINKTKSVDHDKSSTLKLEQQQRQEREIARAKKHKRELERRGKEEARLREEEKKKTDALKRYDTLMTDDNMESNANMDGYDSDDFM